MVCGSRTCLGSAYGMGQVIKELRAFVFGCRPEAAATRELDVVQGRVRLVDRACQRPESLSEEEGMTRKVQGKGGPSGMGVVEDLG